MPGTRPVALPPAAAVLAGLVGVAALAGLALAGAFARGEPAAGADAAGVAGATEAGVAGIAEAAEAAGTPPAGGAGTPPAGDAASPPAGDAGTPPAGDAASPPAGDAGTPPAGGAQPPPATPAPAVTRPAWLGTRPLPRRADGFGQVQSTPPELADRRLPPPSPEPLPPDGGDGFAASAGPVPADVAARSTWTARCPVALEDLRYVTVTFWGFDGRPHRGELLLHARVAGEVVEVFRELFAARFPIEEMRIVAPSELDAPPTGDGNNTTAFVCRPVRGSSSWSQHAYGLAVDVNPFHNPYVRGDVVLPELAGAYTDRGHHRPGMVQRGDVVTAAFARAGWGWGGDWSGLADWMHFSATGR